MGKYDPRPIGAVRKLLFKFQEWFFSNDKFLRHRTCLDNQYVKIGEQGVMYSAESMRWEVSDPNGNRVKLSRIAVRTGPVVSVVAMELGSDPQDPNIWLVSQFRPAIAEDTWEIVAGGVKPGQEPETSMIEELAEEIGMRPVDQIQLLAGYYTSAGWTDEWMSLYLCVVEQIPGQDGGGVDEGEFITRRRFLLSEIRYMIDEGIIKDSKTIVGVRELEYLLLKKKLARSQVMSKLGVG